MMPDPMPPVGWPNGEKPSVLRPLDVIVTTDFWASATIAVRSELWTVVALVVRASAAGAVPTAEAGTSSWTASTVPPAARVALRNAAARTVPKPRPRLDRGASGVRAAGAAGGVAAAMAAGAGGRNGSGLAKTGR